MVPDSFLYRNSPVRTPSLLRQQNKSQELAFAQPSPSSSSLNTSELGRAARVHWPTDRRSSSSGSPCFPFRTSRFLWIELHQPFPCRQHEEAVSPSSFFPSCSLNKNPTRSHSEGKEETPAGIKLTHMCACLAETSNTVLSRRPF